MTFMLVTGAPCSGKSTYVREWRGETDVVLDLDSLAVALGSPVYHGHDVVYVGLAIEARLAALRRIVKRGVNANVWLVTCWPSPEEQLLLPSVAIRIAMTAGREQCQQWAREAERPATYSRLIDAWFAAHAPGVKA